MQGVYQGHEQAYMPQEVQYNNHVRVGSVPVQSGADTHDDKRRKGSAVTATNDKELREMLSKNEGRPLREVAQEVISKERTPMAEKTKQLFAMLWLVQSTSFSSMIKTNVRQAPHCMQTSQDISSSQPSLFAVRKPMWHRESRPSQSCILR